METKLQEIDKEMKKVSLVEHKEAKITDKLEKEEPIAA